jgi:hypothetical protein
LIVSQHLPISQAAEEATLDLGRFRGRRMGQPNHFLASVTESCPSARASPEAQQPARGSSRM